MPFDAPLPAFDVRADFWSIRFVEERSESYAVRKNVAMPFVASTDRGAMATVYADGGYGYAATGDTSAAGLAKALERAAQWARVTARLALFDSRALPLPAPQGRVPVSRLRRPRSVAARVVRPPPRGMRGGELRSPHRRLGGRGRGAHRDPPSRHQRRGRHRAALPFPDAGPVGHRARRRRDPDPIAQRLSWHLPARRHRGPRPLRIRSRRTPHRRGSARASRRAELPERRDGRAARARPDDPADPRVDRASARARPHSRRRAQLRGHELRDPGHVRHLPLRLRPPQHHVRPDQARGARELRLRRRRHQGREGPSHPRRHPAAAAGRGDLAGARAIARRRQLACRQLEPPADRPHGEPEPRARRRDVRRARGRHRPRRADGDQLQLVHRRLAQQVPVRLRARRA